MGLNINVMTWNIDWFRNGTGVANVYSEEDCNFKVFEQIVSVIKEFLNRDNAIVFLQEVPHKIKNDRWCNCECFKKLLEMFVSKEYDVSFEANSKMTTRYTLAISKKGIYTQTNEYKLCNNRIVEMTIGEITLLGVHMPTCFKENDSDDEMWKKLISYASFKKKRTEKIIVLGDFNAYLGCKEKLTLDRYNELLKYISDIMPQEFTYKEKRGCNAETQIDHILTNIDNFSSINIDIEKEYEMSDHKYISAEILFE